MLLMYNSNLKCSKCHPETCKCHPCYDVTVGNCNKCKTNLTSCNCKNYVAPPVNSCPEESYCNEGCATTHSASCINITTSTGVITLQEFYDQYLIKIEECCNPVEPCTETAPVFTCTKSQDGLSVRVDTTYDSSVIMNDISITINGVAVIPTFFGNTLTYTHTSPGVANVEVIVPSLCNTTPFTYTCVETLDEPVDPCADLTASIIKKAADGTVVTDSSITRTLEVVTNCPEGLSLVWDHYVANEWKQFEDSISINAGLLNGLGRLTVNCGDCSTTVYECYAFELQGWRPTIEETINNGIVTFTVDNSTVSELGSVQVKLANATTFTDSNQFTIDFNTYSQRGVIIRYDLPCGQYDFNTCFRADTVPVTNADILTFDEQGDTPCADTLR